MGDNATKITITSTTTATNTSDAHHVIFVVIINDVVDER
jgi:hypothetical protein